MSPLDFPEVAGPTFSASAAWDERTLRVAFKGSAELNVKDDLERLLPRLHSEALRLAAREVVVDFRDLEFMSSACFRSFVSWVSEVQDLPPATQYQILFRSNAAMLWQRRSLHALKCFANELVHIDA